MSSNNLRVCVVGCGVVGVSTGLNLVENHRNVDLTVVSDRDFSQTTSFGPVGIHRLVYPELKHWSRETFDRFSDIYSGIHSADSGLQLISGHVISDDTEWLESNETAVSDVVYNFRWLSQRDLDVFPVKYSRGLFYTTYTSQGNQYVPWMQNQLLRLGAKVQRRKVESLHQLAGEFDVVINCSGLDAGKLTGDTSLMPIRGVLLQVQANWIKHFLFAGDDRNYIIPGKETVIIGGSREKGMSHTNVTTEERKSIWDRSLATMPSLKEAKMIQEWAGLRPHRRDGPRVETESLEITGRKPLRVIHNYGHGGNGFTLSWGCARSVNDLLEQSHRQSSKL